MRGTVIFVGLALHRRDKGPCVWSEEIEGNVMAWDGGIEMEVPLDRIPIPRPGPSETYSFKTRSISPEETRTTPTPGAGYGANSLGTHSDTTIESLRTRTSRVTFLLSGQRPGVARPLRLQVSFSGPRSSFCRPYSARYGSGWSGRALERRRAHSGPGRPTQGR
jgi:hypothetical protein